MSNELYLKIIEQLLIFDLADGIIQRIALQYLHYFKSFLKEIYRWLLIL